MVCPSALSLAQLPPHPALPRAYPCYLQASPLAWAALAQARAAPPARERLTAEPAGPALETCAIVVWLAENAAHASSLVAGILLLHVYSLLASRDVTRRLEASEADSEVSVAGAGLAADGHTRKAHTPGAIGRRSAEMAGAGRRAAACGGRRSHSRGLASAARHYTSGYDIAAVAATARGRVWRPTFADDRRRRAASDS